MYFVFILTTFKGLTEDGTKSYEVRCWDPIHRSSSAVTVFDSIPHWNRIYRFTNLHFRMRSTCRNFRRVYCLFDANEFYFLRRSLHYQKYCGMFTRLSFEKVIDLPWAVQLLPTVHHVSCIMYPVITYVDEIQTGNGVLKPRHLSLDRLFICFATSLLRVL